jgi:hypothetical protein
MVALTLFTRFPVQQLPHPTSILIVVLETGSLRLLLLLGPIQPTSLVVSHVLVTSFAGQLACSGGSLAGTAVKDDLLLRKGFRETVFLVVERVDSEQ